MVDIDPTAIVEIPEITEITGLKGRSHRERRERDGDRDDLRTARDA